MTDSPLGVPATHNGTPYPTKPRWTFAFTVGGESFQCRYDVRREAEARSQLAVEFPDAYDIVATYSEVPF
jgi:hypothetical protein